MFYLIVLEIENNSEEKKITSFIGIFPANSPEFLTFVLFDEPQKNAVNSKETTGGNTAAPTFKLSVARLNPETFEVSNSRCKFPVFPNLRER